MIGTPPAMQGMAPIQGLPPELLAQAAQNAFRPPNPMAMPGMQMPGMGAHDGLGGLGTGMGLGIGAGLGANLVSPGSGLRTPEDNASGFPAGGGPQGPSGGALAPTQQAGGGGFFDWLSRHLGSGSKGIF